MMHSVRGGWSQTFALAKHNESEGKKSRIRRSKEERKAMVESFIKKYQESNNGNFPSLNLTHKEVGGSFYTVREIVRDIIQDNRVLGPAKFTLNELNSDQFSEQNPLGSIAIDPPSLFAASTNENHPVPNKLQDTNGKMLSVSDGFDTEAKHQVVVQGHVINVTNKDPIEATVISDRHYSGAEHPIADKGHAIISSQTEVSNDEPIEATVVSDGYCTGANDEIVDEGNVINGSQINFNLRNKETNGATIPQASEPLALKQNVEEELVASATPIAKVTAVTEDLKVETFPLRPIARTTDGIEGLGELRDSTDSPKKDIKTLKLVQSEEAFELSGVEPMKDTNLLDEKVEHAHENRKFKKTSNTMHDMEENLGDTLSESTNHSTPKEHFGHKFENCTVPQVGVSHQDAITSETINQSQMKDEVKTSIQDKFHAKNHSTSKTFKPSDNSLHKADKLRVDGQPGGNSQIRSNSTLDRINLESWDGTPKNPGKQESNPLLAMLKAFVDAFVKFWSE